MSDFFPITDDFKVYLPDEITAFLKPGIYCWSVCVSPYEMHIEKIEMLDVCKHAMGIQDEFGTDVFDCGTLEVSEQGYIELPDCIKPYVEETGVFIIGHADGPGGPFVRMFFDTTELMEEALHGPTPEEIAAMLEIIEL